MLRFFARHANSQSLGALGRITTLARDEPDLIDAVRVREVGAFRDRMRTELLHKAGDAVVRPALADDRAGPVDVEWPRSWPTLSADDHPIRKTPPPRLPGCEIGPDVDRQERRLVAEETHRPRALEQPR